MTYETIILEKTNRIATITLNRPRAMNAITRKMLREIQNAVNDIKDDPNVKVVVVTAAGTVPSAQAPTSRRWHRLRAITESCFTRR